MAAGAHGSRRHHDSEDDDVGVDVFSEEELARRPEVRIINTYAVFRAYVLMGLKGIGALVLLWATVVLLGGFVSSLKKKDFWYISFISFVQAGGMFNAIGDKQLKHLVIWMTSAMISLHPSRVKHKHVDTQPHLTSCVKLAWSWLKRRIRSMISKLIALIVFVILYLVLSFCAFGPIICAGLSVWRVRQPDYGRVDKDESHANLKPGMDLFYNLCVGQGIIFMFIVIPVEILGTTLSVRIVSQQVGLSREVVRKYCIATKLKYFNNLASLDENWNFITYSAGLLDSEMPEDSAWGARVLTTLIEQGEPVRRLLVRSPGQRMQKLIRTLVWRSPAEVEMRWLTARIIEHVAHDLSLAEFPGALECISSLLSTSGYNKDGDREATIFLSERRHDKQKGKQNSINSESILVKGIKHFIQIYRASTNDGTQDRKEISINSTKGTNEDLILQGLRILENLALDEHNCRVICSNDELFSKIVSPVSSNNLVQDMKKNPAWAKVTDESLKLVSRLMRSTDDTGKEMRCRVATNSSAVKNLEEILALEINSSNIIVLKIRSIQILEQICSVESASTNLAREIRENLIMKVLHIFLTDKWMEDYLSNKRAKIDEESSSQICNRKKSKKSQQASKSLVENKMNAAQETLSKLKEKAGDTLTTLCMENQINYDYIKSFTGCEDVVHYLTEMLYSKERTIRCRFSAAGILKHLCTHCTLDPSYIKDTTLKKVLRELLHIETPEAELKNARKAIQWWCTILYGGSDIENQRDSGHDEHRPVQSHKKQHEQRMLQVALISLCAAIRRRLINAHDFASVVAQLVTPEVLVEKLKKIVEENSYATVSCLATVKLTCEIVIALIPHDHRIEEGDRGLTVPGIGDDGWARELHAFRWQRP